RHGPPSGRLDPLDDRLARGLIQVDDGDGEAVGGQPCGDTGPDAAGPAGHDSGTRSGGHSINSFDSAVRPTGAERRRHPRQTPPVRVMPPSTTRSCPVIQAASSDSRNATAPLTSLGSPSRLSGYAAAASSSRPS